MKTGIPIIVLFSVHFCLTTCRSSKTFTGNELLSSKGESILAWNEDTVNSYQFLLTAERFYYTIIKIDSSGKIEQYYTGTYKINRDTVFLTYKKGRQPADVTNYLVVEGSGNFLIQPLKTEGRRVFLRFRRRPVF